MTEPYFQYRMRVLTGRIFDVPQLQFEEAAARASLSLNGFNGLRRCCRDRRQIAGTENGIDGGCTHRQAAQRQVCASGGGQGQLA